MSPEWKRFNLSSRFSILTGAQRNCKEKSNRFATEVGSAAEVARSGRGEDALVALLQMAFYHLIYTQFAKVQV